MTSRRSVKLTRSEHIIPRMLLANFTDSDGVLWVYAKDKPVRQSIPDNECRERDFYEFELNGRRTQNKYENWLAEVEGEAARIVPSIIKHEVLGPEDRVKWATFVASLFYRTRKVRKQISDAMIERFRKRVEDPDFIREMQCDLLRRGELRYADDLKKEVNELLGQMESSPSYYHVAALPRQTAWIAEIILGRRWDVVDASPGKNFLLSDCPVTTVGINGHLVSTGPGFGGENTAVLLPVTPNVVFVASPHGSIWKSVAPQRAFESINHLIVQFGHRNVYANIKSNEVQELVDREIDQVEFGKTAFVPRSQNKDATNN